MLLPLVKAFWDICLLRSPPQRIPKSGLLQGLAVGSYAVVAFIAGLIDRPVWNALFAAAIHTFLLVGLTHVALWVRDHPERSTQTVTAMAGTSTLVGVLLLPLMRGLHGSTGFVALLQGLLWLGVLVWSIVIVGHILRHAMSVPFLAGNLLAMVYWYISFRVTSALFIQPG